MNTHREVEQTELPSTATPRQITNGTTDKDSHYTPDWVPVRPGSQDHENVPSRMGDRREYRDGRVEAA